MPGIVMDDAGASGASQATGFQSLHNDISKASHSRDRAGDVGHQKNGASYPNGSLGDQPPTGQAREIFRNIDGRSATQEGLSTALTTLPPELEHISQGFFPFAKLINRAVQQCWNDLTDLITELAEVQMPPSNAPNGKPIGNQSNENIHKKVRILEFAQAKRAEFIKLLVLSQWSRQAADVSKLIDLQAFIRMRYDAYHRALLRVGDMKRDLIGAQMGNHDLKTALEVLSTGKVARLSELGFISPKHLTPKKMLKTLQKINKMINIRLILHDTIPPAFTNYVVHDGRVTFTVRTEFEIDLSIALEDYSSQFFFVDIRFLFSPSSPVPKGRLFDDVDRRINTVLMNSGLVGCFNFFHNLILTDKVTILFKQAVELARGHWLDVLRVELLHRTLVVQYWVNRLGAKSWIEIGVRSGRPKQQRPTALVPDVPFLSLRWIRDNKEVDAKDIAFDLERLSMDSIIRSVVALHASYLLCLAYTKLCDGGLYANGILSIHVQTSAVEPGDCHLNVQLTKSRHLRVIIEPVSGAITLRPTPLLLNRLDNDRHPDRPSIEDRISRLRCFAAMEEIESRSKTLGWEVVTPRGVKNEDIRRLFPSNTLRFVLFRRKSWESNWVVAATSSMDGDNWWVLQLREGRSALPQHIVQATHSGPFTIKFAHMVTGRFVGLSERLKHSSFAELDHALSGMIVIQANALYLAELGVVHHFPPARKLFLGAHLRVPSIFIRFQSVRLPHALQISPIAGEEMRPVVRDTVRLSFRGIDRHTKYAILVAYGRIVAPIKDVTTLALRTDAAITFQPKGGGFAMRFLAPVGQSVIVSLLSRLQQLEHVVSTVESLKIKQLRPQSLSLSRIHFAYSSGDELQASIKFSYREQSGPLDIGASDLLSKVTPLSCLHMTLDFNHENPHRRIKVPLAATLNASGRKSGLDTVAELLILTLPLLRALEHVSTNPATSQPSSSKVQVTARSAKVYQIRYPSPRFRFHISVGQRRDRVIWILKDSSIPNEISNRGCLEEQLRDKIYNSKGDGWKGLDKGAIADAEKVGNLISVLDGVMKAYVPVENILDLENSSHNYGTVSGGKSTAGPPGTKINNK